MSTYQARHAMVELEASSQRRLLVRGGLVTAAATAVGGVGFLTPTFAAPATADLASRSTATRRTLKLGSRGLAVASLQRRLLANGYWHSGADGQYGQTTQQAVMALQKVNGLTRDGVCGPATWSAFETMYRPRGRTTSGTVMEVDLTKQLIIFVVSGRTKWVMNTSTGAAGWRTPPGRFEIFRSVNRMDYGPLGALWRPRYFNRGIAIHGSPSIPGYPASHGCTRVSNAAVNYVWSAGLAPIGRRVWVY